MSIFDPLGIGLAGIGSAKFGKEIGTFGMKIGMKILWGKIASSICNFVKLCEH